MPSLLVHGGVNNFLQNMCCDEVNRDNNKDSNKDNNKDNNKDSNKDFNASRPKVPPRSSARGPEAPADPAEPGGDPGACRTTSSRCPGRAASVHAVKCTPPPIQ